MKVISARDIGRAVRRQRKQLGMTQTQLAQQLGCDQGWISRVENGKDTVALGATLRLLASIGLTLAIDSHEATEQPSGRSAASSRATNAKVDLADVIRRHKKT